MGLQRKSQKKSQKKSRNHHNQNVPSDRPSKGGSDQLFVVGQQALARGFPVTILSAGKKTPILDDYNKPSRFIRTEEHLLRFVTKQNSKCGVGIPSVGGVNNLMFLDIDADGVEDRIVRETGKPMPETYTVQSRPETAKHKKHFYFRQTAYSVRKISKQINVKDLSKWTESKNTGLPLHPTTYDVKGVGGGGFVVAAGTWREDTDECYEVLVDAEVKAIDDYLVDWIVADKARYGAELEAKRQAQLNLHLSDVAAGVKNPRRPNIPEDLFYFVISRVMRLRKMHASDELCCKIISDLIVQDFEDGENIASKYQDAIARRVAQYAVKAPYSPTKKDIAEAEAAEKKIQSRRTEEGFFAGFSSGKPLSVSRILRDMFSELPLGEYSRQEMRENVKAVWDKYEPDKRTHKVQVSKAGEKKGWGWNRKEEKWQRVEQVGQVEQIGQNGGAQ